MKIVYILNSTDIYGGATKSFTSLLYTLLEKDNIDPLVIIPDANGIKDEFDKKGIKTVVLNYRPNIYPYNATFKDYLLWVPRLIYWRYLNVIAVKKLSKHIKGYDLVHTNVSVIDIGQRSAKKQKIPHIYHFREYADLDFGMHYYPCRRLFHNTVTYSICITHGVQQYNNLQNLDTSRVIYDPVNINEKQNIANTFGCYFLYAGRIEETKGIEDLLYAYSEASVKSDLLVAGRFLDISYETKIYGLTKKLGLEDKVHYLGNREDILALMSNAKALVVSSHFEGYGRPMAEAMAQKCLVIGRNTAGTKEQFDNGKKYTGDDIGFRFSSTSELAEIMQKVENMSEEKLNDIRERAYKTIKHYYSNDISAEQVLNFYQSILKTNENPLLFK